MQSEMRSEHCASASVGAQRAPSKRARWQLRVPSETFLSSSRLGASLAEAARRLTETYGHGNKGVTRRCKGWALSRPHGLQTKRTCTMAIARPQEQADKNNTPSLRSGGSPRQRPKGSRQPSRHVPDASVLFVNPFRSSPQVAPKQAKNRNSQEQKAPLLGPLLLLLRDWTALVMSEMSQ